MKVEIPEFDVVVVGAGPAGSVAAEALARASLRVALLEEHPAVGRPSHCSGLVSPRTLELAGVAEETVGLVRFSDAQVWGPGARTFWLRSDSVQAIAIDRPRFDQTLAGRAADAGARLMLGARACHYERLERGVEVQAQTRHDVLRLRASLLIGADGARSQVGQWMGRRHKHEIIPTVQAEAVFQRQGTDHVNIFVGNDVAPGWFGWIIPAQGRVARIGIGATRSPWPYFEPFVNLIRHRFGALSVREIKRATLPLGPARGFVADRVMLVGAAARQTKPTTGGGIYFGIRAAQLAAATALQAIEQGDCSYRMLAEYEQTWHRFEGKELMYGHWLRRGFQCLSDSDLAMIVELCSRPWARDLISRLGDIDFPSRLFIPLITSLRTRATRAKSLDARHFAGLRV
jgi:digeranylgeranylglycerophospholipid reductase